jgi:hypothetical protein
MGGGGGGGGGEAGGGGAVGLGVFPGDGHEGAAEGGVADLPAAAGGADDRIADGQAQAGAGAVLGDAVEAVEQPGAFGLGDAGAAVLHGQADPVALGLDADPHLPVGARVTAGVVHQHAGQPVDPVRRRADQHGIGAGVRGDRGPDRAEPVGAGLGQRDQVHRLVARGRRPGVEPGQPQHVVDQLAQAAALALDAGQRVPVLGRLARAGQGHVGLGPDHAERGAQLV